MTFMTTGANANRVATNRSLAAHATHRTSQHHPYAFLTARDLRGIVAAMVD
ncbi:hypothetical protein [Erythrobacter neustonensis]|uniref:hypothetical protein n=1 Tax=Erythrobacter neustonensis TaxID=1112 RepID=UPI000AB085DC|nr:hypothetical protein [Erythrobacter neustonensis]